MPFLGKIPFLKKDEKVPIFENDDVELFWEYINSENFEEWKKYYEPDKTRYLIKKFLKLLINNNSYDKLLLKLKLFEWDIRTIKLLISFYQNGYFYFLKLKHKKSQKHFYLGFITFLDNFYPYNCNLIKCNNLIITPNKKFPFVWFIYAHHNYKQLMQKIFKKEIKYTDLCDYLISKTTQSDIYWLKSDNEELLNKVYTYERNFFPLECNKKSLTSLRKNSALYRCKIIK